MSFVVVQQHGVSKDSNGLDLDLFVSVTYDDEATKAFDGDNIQGNEGSVKRSNNNDDAGAVKPTNFGFIVDLESKIQGDLDVQGEDEANMVAKQKSPRW